ncbi:SDR family oxidoreductase [Thermodesulfobacteriota bacterium B35]
MKGVAGRVAIVTGGTVGIGRQVCLALARRGARVVAVGRSRQRLEDIGRELAALAGDSRCLALAGDVRREQDVEAMAAETLARFGRIDILVAAAGILRGGDGSLRLLKDMSLAEWDEVLDTNLRGVFLANRAVLPAMIRQGGGDIVNLSSTSGKKGLAFDSAYCASKFAVIGLTEALAVEAARYGIRVRSLLPGAIETGMWNQNGPLPRPGAILPVERVAEMVIWMLANPEDMDLDGVVIEPAARGLHSGWLAHHSKRSQEAHLCTVVPARIGRL